MASVPLHTTAAVHTSGHCARCGCAHVLEEGDARGHCLELMRRMDEQRRIDLDVPDAQADPRFSLDVLLGEARGHMFGVMVYARADGTTGTMRAFSGQYNGVWEVPGWAPPLVDVARFDAVNVPGEREIKALGRRLEACPAGSREYLAVKRLRREKSRLLMKRLHDLFVVRNFRGETRPLREAFLGEGAPPTGTGDCCAPKLVQYAAVNGYRPLGLAEFYWGRENRSGTRRHGEFYSSCADKCAPILGFMLCGLEKAGED